MREIECIIKNNDLVKRNWLPNYATVMSAGIDLRAMFESQADEIIYPDQVKLIPTGIRIHINDPGLVGVALPKSGLGSKNGIILSNTAGVIDSDYQGEILLSCWNRSESKYELAYGERIAQLLFVKIEQVQFKLCEEFSNSTARSTGGFGSTGKI